MSTTAVVKFHTNTGKSVAKVYVSTDVYPEANDAGMLPELFNFIRDNHNRVNHAATLAALFVASRVNTKKYVEINESYIYCDYVYHVRCRKVGKPIVRYESRVTHTTAVVKSQY